ncbi:F-box only protein 9-like [Oscarella lobularis]|uniref:F-box only protein 9-like n=1 Tax=Oscarella lobularis TaxID=121494 RepID=UPI0033137768
MEDTEELKEFRLQWQEELQTNQETKTSDKRTKAADLFLKGIASEREGRHYDALHYYRRALQLDPGVESRMPRGDDVFTLPGRSYENDVDSSNEAEGVSTQHKDDDLGADSQKTSLSHQFTKCQSMRHQTMTHISVLPQELLVHVFKWVVSGDLDMRSLEHLALVCKSFYACARDAELWRLACQKLWGCCQLTAGMSWRQLYISQPHLLFDGVYISRSSYVRAGEPSLDQFYKPYHTVEYFRYLRFFSDGTLIYLNSPESPLTCVPKFKVATTATTTGFQSGRYQLSEDELRVEIASPSLNNEVGLRYQSRGAAKLNESSDCGRTFHMTFHVRNVGRRRCAKLVWASYTCRSMNSSTGQLSVTEFSLNETYRPFMFSRVKSFFLESTRILQ